MSKELERIKPDPTPVVEPDEIVEERDGKWERVPVVEERVGFTVKDRRSVR